MLGSDINYITTVYILYIILINFIQFYNGPNPTPNPPYSKFTITLIIYKNYIYIIILDIIMIYHIYI